MIGIVIVDDEPLIREGLKTLINWEEEGFEIIGEAKNGREAISIIDKVCPKIVITDIKMPGITGLDLIEHYNKKNSDIVFMVLSGYADFAYAQNAIKLKVDSYILKPIDKYELLEELHKIKKNMNHLFARFDELTIGDNDFIIKIKEYINNNYQQNIMIEEIANIMHYNSVYLGRAFKKATGQSVNNYIDFIRISKAKELLECEKKVKDVAFAVGYNSQDYFTEKFKKFVGVTPREYKRLLNENKKM